MKAKATILLLGVLTLSSGFSPRLRRSNFSPISNSHMILKSETAGKDAAAMPSETRSNLLEEAKKIDANLAEGKTKGEYAPSGWSNRVGMVLTPAAVPGVYTADRPFYWNNIDVGGRMTVIRLDDGDLWIHSPVELDEPLKDALAKLGTVKYIVAPNYEHLKYSPQWAKAFPDAFMWGCPGLAERMPEVQWEGEIPSHIFRPDGNKLENCWDFNIIVPLHIDVEVNPFTGNAFFNEVIFYHSPSKSLLTTDFFWNYPTSDGVPNSHLGGSEWELAPAVDSIPLGSRLWKKGMDIIYLPFYKKLMVKNRPRFDDMVQILLKEWEIETLIPAHGDIIRGSNLISKVLEKHFSM